MAVAASTVHAKFKYLTMHILPPASGKSLSLLSPDIPSLAQQVPEVKTH